MTDFHPQKNFGTKKITIIQKKIQLGFSSKIEVPSLARLGSAQLGKISAQTHHYGVGQKMTVKCMWLYPNRL